ncbi:MAG: lipoyl(octanoyl) transferase LipB [Methylococcales bacterium]|nr:lipoyl(octanoyl) transferase LipB [Methylococcales bacterium]
MRTLRDIITHDLGLQDYTTVWQAMQDFTLQRTADTPDELWIVEHPAVYTLGLNGKREHLLNTGDIPVIQSDRGGQVTYHGHGQVIIYTLLDIKRLNINIRELVSLLEQTMIDTLTHYGIVAIAKADAPGVYVQGKKIGSIGIRIKNSCSYHGLSFNNNMDLTPFNYINPCGYKNLQVTQLADLGITISTPELAAFMSQVINTLLSNNKW